MQKGLSIYPQKDSLWYNEFNIFDLEITCIIGKSSSIMQMMIALYKVN